MRQSIFLTTSLLFFLLIACSEQSEQEVVMQSPAQVGSELPRFTQTKNGDIFLSWVNTKQNTASLFYSKLTNNKWSEPQQIAQGNNWFVNWADYPALMINNELMAAHWLQKRDVGTYDYDIHMSLSVDGINWGSSFIPHKDGISAEHGFVSMLPIDIDHFFATWLDGRNTKSTGHDHSQMEHNGAMSLRAGIFDAKGETIDEWELDHMTCDCCQTAAALTPNGPVVVYRDRTENEIRDIAITRLVDGNWSEPMPVYNDLWQIAGCPVNGPAIASSSDQLAVVWYSGSRQVPKVQVAISNDWGKSFRNPILISEGNTLGRVGITSLSDGSFVVSRLETRNDKAIITLSQINQTGDILKTVEVVSTSMERASGFPTITARENEVLVAWTDVSSSSLVKIKSVKF